VKKSDFVEAMKKTQAPLKKMVEMVPDDKLDWAPGEGFMTVGQVLKHLSENWCCLRMMITQDWPFKSPDEMVDSMKLENMPSCSPAEAFEAMEKDLNEAVAYLETEISDDDFFGREIAAPWGFKGEIYKGLLMMQEHQLNHKMQLHLYLKLLGQPVNTETLYAM
jgi:hypothetical protein